MSEDFLREEGALRDGRAADDQLPGTHQLALGCLCEQNTFPTSVGVI